MIEHSAADVLAQHLIGTGLFTLPSAVRPWPMTIGSMPNSPDSMATIYNTNGFVEGRDMRGKTHDKPGWLIRIRGRDERIVNKKIQALLSALDEIDKDAISVETVDYLIFSMRRTTSPISLGPEVGTGRLLFTVNGTLTYDEV